MPTIAQLLSMRPAGRVILYGASGAAVSVDYRAYRGTPARLADVLDDWDLLDDAGVKVPPTSDGLQSVDDDVQALILSAILAHAHTVTHREGSV